jgi:anti-sigma regulatory factor (Ser/Thr protein kinase)
MAYHALLAESHPGPSVLEQAVRAAGWRLTRVDAGPLAHARLRHGPPDVVLVGARLAGLSPGHFIRAVKLDHACNAVPLVRLGPPAAAAEVEVEPDAWLDPASACLRAAVAVARECVARAQREGTRAEVRFRLPSDPGQLEVLNRLLGPWFAACGLGAHQAQQLNLAFREVGANAIEWGHGYDSSRVVSVACRLDAEKVSIFVRDDGPGFDPGNVPHAARPGDPLSHLGVRAALKLREGGFGILLARGMVDYLCYNDAGNEAHLVKYLPSRLQHPGYEPVGAPLPLR